VDEVVLSKEDDITHDSPRHIVCIPVKKAGLAIANPMETADTNWTALMLICGHLISRIRGMEEFSSTEHTSIMKRARPRWWHATFQNPKTSYQESYRESPVDEAILSKEVSRRERGSRSSLPLSMGPNSCPKSSVMPSISGTASHHPTYLKCVMAEKHASH
jgi:hypothetical protein